MSAFATAPAHGSAADSAAEPAQTPPAGAAPWPSGGRAWYAVAVFAVVLCVNFLDRGILPLLVEPIKLDLGLSDTQISLVMGFAFVCFYLLLGLPIARLVDRTSRRRIIAVGVATWSAATALCGTAHTFVQLFLARIGVGVGEACNGPATYSMLADLFPRDQLPRAVAFLNFGFVAGLGLSAILGGAVIGALQEMPPMIFPVLGLVKPWQMTFFAVGIPGLFVALLLATVVEPPRRESRPASAGVAPIREVLAYLTVHRDVYLPIFLTLAIQSIPAQGMVAWSPAFFMRVYHWSAHAVGIAFGTILLMVAPVGLLSGGFLAERLARGGRNDANLIVQLIAIAGWIPTSVAMVLMPTPHAALWAFGLSMFFAMLAPGPQNAALQIITPNRMRGQVTALFLFVFNIVGFGLGPTAIALLTDFMLRDEARVGSALAVATAVLGPLSLWTLWRGIKPYGRMVSQLER